MWPTYLDSNATRSMGRRVPLSVAVSSPTVDEIVRAAQLLGLNPVVEEKAYPRAWYQDRARVVVDKKYGRSKTLALIAAKIRELRASKRQA